MGSNIVNINVFYSTFTNLFYVCHVFFTFLTFLKYNVFYIYAQNHPTGRTGHPNTNMIVTCLLRRNALDVEVDESDVYKFRRQSDELIEASRVAWVQTGEVGRRERTVLSRRRRVTAIRETTTYGRPTP